MEQERVKRRQGAPPQLDCTSTVGWAEASTIVARRLGCTAYAEYGHTMNPKAVLAVHPNSKEEAKSLKEIAQAMSLDIPPYRLDQDA